MGHAVREETHGHVRRLTLCRPDRYISNAPQLRDEMGAAIDAAQRDSEIRVILLDAEESAHFGYPPARVWGVPEAPWNWVARLGLQNARRYMLTGDEFTAGQALEMGAVLEVVPDDELHDPKASRRLGTLFDGVGRHTREGLAFVGRSTEVGFRQAVRERDQPFGDCGERRS